MYLPVLDLSLIDLELFFFNITLFGTIVGFVLFVALFPLET